MIENFLRPIYQKILVNPVARLLVKSPHMSANIVTLISAILGILVALALYFHLMYSGLLLLLLSGYCDTLDGTLARMQGCANALGTSLDIVADRVVEFSVILGLYLIHPVSNGVMCLFMLGSVLICITSFLVVGIYTENDSEKGFYYSPGIIERPEAFVFFVLMILLPSNFYILGWLFSVLVFLTAFVRLWQFSKYQ